MTHHALLQLLNTREHFDQAVELLASLQDPDLCDSILKGVKWSPYKTRETTGTRGQPWVHVPGNYYGPQRVYQVLNVAVGPRAEALRENIHLAYCPEAYFPNLRTLTCRPEEARHYEYLHSLHVRGDRCDITAPRVRVVTTQGNSMSWALDAFPDLLDYTCQEHAEVIPDIEREGLFIKTGRFACVFVEGRWVVGGSPEHKTMVADLRAERQRIDNLLYRMRNLS